MNEKFFDLKKEKQDRMINAALKVFAINGYQKASTDDIVKDGVEAAKNILNLNKDDIVVVVGGSPATAHTNFIKIERI